MNTLLAVLGALGPLTFIGTTINVLVQRRKIRAEAQRTTAQGEKFGADAARVLAETATDLLQPLRDELRAAHEEITAMRHHLARVEALLREHGVPVPTFVYPSKNGNGVKYYD
jgi:hypothetical protein